MDPSLTIFETVGSDTGQISDVLSSLVEELASHLALRNVGLFEFRDRGFTLRDWVGDAAVIRSVDRLLIRQALVRTGPLVLRGPLTAGSDEASAERGNSDGLGEPVFIALAVGMDRRPPVGVLVMFDHDAPAVPDVAVEWIVATAKRAARLIEHERSHALAE